MAGEERVFVGLGANLGRASASVRAAIGQLAGVPRTRVIAASSLYRSAPIDAEGPDYINAVAELATALTPEQLLSELQGIERQHERERPYAHAPRTLDLDLLFFGERRIDSPDLTVPHPRVAGRAFVLAPLAELAPSWRLADGRTAADALAALAHQDVQRIVE